MPHIFNNILVVTKDELVPLCYNTLNSLQVAIIRYENKEYGIKRVQRGGRNRELLISFDSLPIEYQNLIGDPRKAGHILERFYKVDGEAVTFYAKYQFDDYSYLDPEHQERYIINASVLKACIALKEAREQERKSKGGSLSGIMTSICGDACSFQKTLQTKYGVQHTLPESEKRFKEAFKNFVATGFKSLISAKHKNANSRKVTDETLNLLKALFAGQSAKPTATQVHRQYSAFLSGYISDVISNETGEVYNPKDFKKLSDATVKNYMASWENAIATEAVRSGDRQKYMQKFKPHYSFDKPKFAGSIISVDDRQPPFKMPNGNRIWFYNAIDLASEAFTCWVHGDTKEGIILEFYRQLVRNYADWGLNLPAEIECEMSLNSSFVNTFLREGAMFKYVKMEANNARGKRIERFYGNLRYDEGFEKDRAGWLGRPHARRESNQPGAEKIITVPYDEIVQGCLADIEKWNNMPHSENPELSRWEVFMQRQNPDLPETNYQSFLPYIGRLEKSSVNAGIIRFRNTEFLLGQDNTLFTGDRLIAAMKRVEGQNINIYWLDANDGSVLKALVYLGAEFICEAVAKPKPQRARAEQTEQDLINQQLMAAYVTTIEGFGRSQRKAIDKVTIINAPQKAKKAFVMPGLKTAMPIADDYQEPEILDTETTEQELVIPTQSFVKSIRDRF